MNTERKAATGQGNAVNTRGKGSGNLSTSVRSPAGRSTPQPGRSAAPLRAQAGRVDQRAAYAGGYSTRAECSALGTQVVRVRWIWQRINESGPAAGGKAGTLALRAGQASARRAARQDDARASGE